MARERKEKKMKKMLREMRKDFRAHGGKIEIKDGAINVRFKGALVSVIVIDSGYEMRLYDICNTILSMDKAFSLLKL